MRRIDALEIDAKYGGGPLAWLETQCPDLAASDDVRFYEDAPDGRTLRLVIVYMRRRGGLLARERVEVPWVRFWSSHPDAIEGVWSRASALFLERFHDRLTPRDSLRATLPLAPLGPVPECSDRVFMNGAGQAFARSFGYPDVSDLFDADPYEAEDGADEPPVDLGVCVVVLRQPTRRGVPGAGCTVEVALTPYAAAILDRRGIPYEDLRATVEVRWSRDGQTGDGPYPR